MNDHANDKYPAFSMIFLDEDIAYALKAIDRVDQRGRDRLKELRCALEELKPGEQIAIWRKPDDQAR